MFVVVGLIDTRTLGAGSGELPPPLPQPAAIISKSSTTNKDLRVCIHILTRADARQHRFLLKFVEMQVAPKKGGQQRIAEMENPTIRVVFAGATVGS